MGILLHYSLGLYFAAMFGVSGLAKLEQPQEVGKALWRLSRLPLWGLTAIVYLVSGGEIVLATLLVLCIAPVFTASVALIAFVIFLAFKIIAAVVRRGADCGCYGAALRQPVEVSSVATSAILAVAGLIYIWATMHVATVPWSWRCLVGLCFLGSLAFLFLRMRQRSRIDGSLEHREVSGSSRIIESNLQPGDHLPFDPGVCLPRYAFVLFVGRGCPHCATLCEALTDISLGNWALIIVMVDHEDMRMHAMPVDFPIPDERQ